MMARAPGTIAGMRNDRANSAFAAQYGSQAGQARSGERTLLGFLSIKRDTDIGFEARGGVVQRDRVLAGGVVPGQRQADFARAAVNGHQPS